MSTLARRVCLETAVVWFLAHDRGVEPRNESVVELPISSHRKRGCG